MPPLINPSILSANPNFGALYHDLWTNRVNEDGTSRSDPKALKEQQIFANVRKDTDLRVARLDRAKRHCANHALKLLANGDGSIPDELLELVMTYVASTSGDITGEDQDLVEVELEKFKEDNRRIASALGEQIRYHAATLSLMVAPKEPPNISELPRAIRGLQADIADSSTQLSQGRVKLAHSITSLLDIFRQLIEASIRTLEQTLHGSIARGTKAQADYLATVVEGMNKKLGLQHAQLMQQVYSADMQAALRLKADDVERETRLCKSQVRQVEDELAEYGRVQGVQGMVKQYLELVKERESVELDIMRLQT